MQTLVMKISIPLLCILLHLAVAAPADADCAFEASVRVDSSPVPGAVVKMLEADVTARSDTDGLICLDTLAPGAHTMLVIAEGFSVLDARLEKKPAATSAYRGSRSRFQKSNVQRLR